MMKNYLVVGLVGCSISCLVFGASGFVGRQNLRGGGFVLEGLRTSTTRLCLQTSNATAVAVTAPAVPSTSTELASRVRSVNFHISRKCNYACKFCFHTQKTTHHLTLAQASLGLNLLQQEGCEKINFAGGEPFLQANLLGELCRISHELGMAVSIISNGSLITEKWMKAYGKYVDLLGVSIDSFVPATNAAIGRTSRSSNTAAKDDIGGRIWSVRDMCWKHSIKFKMNTVVCSLNWNEDMSEHVVKLKPDRWKVFQVLVLEQENAGGPGDLRDARHLQVSEDQFWSFVDRHRQHSFASKVLIPEPNDVMRNSYLLLDEEMRFLDSSSGVKIAGESILKVGVAKALMTSGFDYSMFVLRGGLYDWGRERHDSN